jgi:phage major head subunit gpT-like protein
MNPITQSELDALRVGFSTIFETGFGQTEVYHDKVCTEVPSGGYSNIYGWAITAFNLRQWVGPRMAQNMREHAFELVNLPFEGTVELDLRKIETDRNTIGVFKQTAMAGLSYAAARHPGLLLRSMLQSNSGNGPTGFDGVPLFDSAHPNYNETGSGATTYDNIHSLAFSADNFETVYTTMTEILGEDGLPLGVNPTHIMCAPRLKRDVLEVLSSTTYGQGGAATNAIDNVMRGWVEPIFVPELANDPTAWYLLDLSRPIKPFIFQKKTSPVLTALDQLTSEKVFNEKKAVYGVDYEGNVGPSLPFLVAKSKP